MREGVPWKGVQESKAVLNVNNEFYGGEEVDINYALDLVDEATVVSIVGERAIGEAIKRALSTRMPC